VSETTVEVDGRVFHFGRRYSSRKHAAGLAPGPLTLDGWSLDRKLLVAITDAGSRVYFDPKMWAQRAGEEFAR
jgi:hypothetical protein